MRRCVAIVLAIAGLAFPAAPASAAPGSTPLAWRGIVEGAYGRPWTHGERMDVLRWMADHGMNAYVHAPKDDPYQRTNWRSPYPEDQQAEFNREVRLARRLGIEWIPSLSPALPLIPTLAPPAEPPSRDLCFSCPRDLDATVAKLEPFLAAGSRAVMISFDDVTKFLTHPEDLAAYGTGDRAFGAANGDFLTRLRERLRARRAGVRVLTVGADYFGVRGTAYLEGLRSALAPGIDVLWTGTGVPSEPWTPADADSYARQVGRRPVVWENWTNNDTAGNAIAAVGAARIFLGPYVRDPRSARAVAGFLFNPANEAYLNLLPLATAAEWMAAPGRYRARRSWLGAVRELAPGRSAGARRRRASLRAWAEASWSNKLDREREAPTFVRKAGEFLVRYRAGGNWPAAGARLERELGLVEAASQRLATLPEPGIAAQGTDFLDAAAKTARTGELATRLLVAERPQLELERSRNCTGDGTDCGWTVSGTAKPPDPDRAAGFRAELGPASAAALLDSEFTYGWRTPVAFEIPPYAVPRNVMDAFVAEARALDSAWQPDAAAAAGGVDLTLDGMPVPTDAEGTFRLQPNACGLLAATDGAGGRTSVRIPCRPGARRGGGARFAPRRARG